MHTAPAPLRTHNTHVPTLHHPSCLDAVGDDSAHERAPPAARRRAVREATSTTALISQHDLRRSKLPPTSFPPSLPFSSSCRRPVVVATCSRHHLLVVTRRVPCHRHVDLPVVTTRRRHPRPPPAPSRYVLRSAVASAVGQLVAEARPEPSIGDDEVGSIGPTMPTFATLTRADATNNYASASPAPQPPPSPPPPPTFHPR